MGVLVISHYVRLTRPFRLCCLPPVEPFADVIGNYIRRDSGDNSEDCIQSPHPLSLRRRGSGLILAALPEFVNQARAAQNALDSPARSASPPDFPVDKPAGEAYNTYRQGVCMSTWQSEALGRGNFRVLLVISRYVRLTRPFRRRCLISCPTICRCSRQLHPPRQREQRRMRFPHGSPPSTAEARQHVDSTAPVGICQFSPRISRKFPLDQLQNPWYHTIAFVPGLRLRTVHPLPDAA